MVGITPSNQQEIDMWTDRNSKELKGITIHYCVSCMEEIKALSIEVGKDVHASCGKDITQYGMDLYVHATRPHFMEDGGNRMCGAEHPLHTGDGMEGEGYNTLDGEGL